MILDHKDYQLFTDTYLRLLCFIGQKQKVVPIRMDFQEFLDLPRNKRLQCREALYEHMDLLQAYLQANAADITPEQKSVLKGFRKFIRSDFIVLKSLTNHAVFMDTRDHRFYAVCALTEPFDQFFVDLPALCHTVLLPFRDKIVYDGFIQPSGVHFGRSVKMSMKEDYRLARLNKQLVKSL